MRTNLVLLTIASVLGIGLGFAGGSLILGVYRDSTFAQPEGSSFENLDELRQTIDQSDSRDIKPDASVSLRAMIRSHPSDLIIYELVPNLDVRFQRVRVQTNSHGMRGPEVSLEKPEGTYRIALLGDSFAFGWGVEYPQTFAAEIEHILNEKKIEGIERVEVLNFGVPGYSTFQEVSSFMEKGIAFSPDVVLVYFVNNDFGLPFFIRDFNNENSANLTTEHQFRSGESSKNAEGKARAAKFINGINANYWLSTLAAFCGERKIPLSLAINPRRNWKSDFNGLPLLHDQSSAGIEFIPLRDKFVALIDERGIDRTKLAFKGDPHPTPLMHGLLAELMVPPLEKNLREVASR